ncbi:hypothetical protein B0A55_07256 [Friedmanniomyces simplex]|uniref:Uncharacterized protein n=1 Tax=Friedmanniomyces simplex TaxID=329884 RepID=A0A4U0X6R7_9PEZI|nr:hypothetical protein B0A55_07256 [Friedmanniomyces simplex]
MKPYSWALVCRKAAGEKVVRCGPKDWISEDKAEKLDLTIIPIVNSVRSPTVNAPQQHHIRRTAELLTAPQSQQKDIRQTLQTPMKLRLQQDVGQVQELRLEILGYLVDEDLAVFLSGGYGPPTGMDLPSIAYVNKLIRAEYISLALENTTFTIHSGAGNDQFQKWLSGIDL